MVNFQLNQPIILSKIGKFKPTPTPIRVQLLSNSQWSSDSSGYRYMSSLGHVFTIQHQIETGSLQYKHNLEFKNPTRLNETKELRALVLVILKNYITILNTTKYKFMVILMEPKLNNLAPQLQCTTKSGCARQLIGKRKYILLNCVFTLLYIKYIVLFICLFTGLCSEYIILLQQIYYFIVLFILFYCIKN